MYHQGSDQDMDKGSDKDSDKGSSDKGSDTKDVVTTTTKEHGTMAST